MIIYHRLPAAAFLLEIRTANTNESDNRNVFNEKGKFILKR